MVSDVKEIMAEEKVLEHHLKMQLEDAMAEEKETYLRLTE